MKIDIKKDINIINKFLISMTSIWFRFLEGLIVIVAIFLAYFKTKNQTLEKLLQATVLLFIACIFFFAFSILLKFNKNNSLIISAIMLVVSAFIAAGVFIFITYNLIVPQSYGTFLLN